MADGGENFPPVLEGAGPSPRRKRARWEPPQLIWASIVDTNKPFSANEDISDPTAGGPS